MRPAAPRSGDNFFEFSLLLLVATGFAAVVSTGRLDRGTTLAAGAALVARAFLIRGWVRVPLSEIGVRILTIAYIGFYPIDFLYLSGNFLSATVRLVFFLAAIKLLTARTGRDYLYLGVIAFLELLSAAMLTSSPAILGFLILFLILAVAARTRYEIHASTEKAALRAASGNMRWKLAALSTALALGIAALGLGLFFVVPRAAGAYLSRLPATGESILGFSGEVVLGDSGRLQKSDTPVLRVRFLEGKPAGPLKWRGGALQHFDGIKWSNPEARSEVRNSPQGRFYLPETGRRRRLGLENPLPGLRPVAAFERVRYQVMRSAMDCDALFLPGIPEMVEGDFSRMELHETDSLSVPGARWKALRYQGSSWISSGRPTELRGWEGSYPAYVRWRYLQLPELDPRIPQLARYITDPQVRPYWRAAALEHYLRTEFSYSLDLPAEPPADPLADFLFQRKKGHCEYFASAMTVMLRSIGIPARLANGFQGGVYNPVSGQYTIRASDAHAWVEAYFPGGWVTFDPTPPEPEPGAAVARAWLYLDALEAFWDEWIVEYDLGRQVTLARALQNKWYDAGYETIAGWDRGWEWVESRWRDWRQSPATASGPVVTAVAAALACCLAAMAWPRIRTALAAQRVKRGRGSVEDCVLLYERALTQMKRRGLVRQNWETPEEFAAGVNPPYCPRNRAALFRQITMAYNRARFGRDGEAARQLPLLLQALEALPR